MKIFKPNRGNGFVKGSERVGEITTTYMSDDFTGNDGDPPDLTKWNVISVLDGDGSYLNIQENKYEFNGNSEGGHFDECYAHVFGLGIIDAGENFTVDIDWNLESFAIPEEIFGSAWNYFQFAVLTEGGGFIGQVIRSVSFNEGQRLLGSSFAGGDNDTIAMTDTSGQFRFKRVSNIITLYYKVNGTWEWDGNAAGLNIGTSAGAVKFYMRFNQGTGTPMLVQVDNFIAAISTTSNRAMYVFDKEAQPKVFKSFNKKVRRPKIWR